MKKRWLNWMITLSILLICVCVLPSRAQAATPIETGPMATGPVVTEPMATGPVVTEPMATGPVVTEPVATEPVVTEPAPTEPGTSAGNLTFTLNEDGESYSVTDCDSSATGSLTIPATYNNKPVTSIGSYAFYNCTSLTSITIPDSVTSIGKCAFENCATLTSVTIPDRVTTIDSYAFYDCDSLTSVTIGNGVTSIGNYAFSWCSNLTSITIPDSVTSIGYAAFSGCNNLQYNTYSNAKYLGNSSNPYVYLAKAKATGITSCNIHSATKFIGEDAFYYCTSLTSITIPDSVTSIGEDAFSGCSSLTSITIPDSVTSIGNSVFSGCARLTGIIIPNSVTSIGSYAFSGCTNLTSITIPDSVTSIGEEAFSDCTNLTSITIPDSVTSIGDLVFSGCSKLQFNIYDKAKYLGNSDNPYVYLAKASTTSITSCNIHNATKTIGSYAFYNCTNLTSVTIPNGVTSIGSYAFYNCTNLTSVTIPNGVTSIGSYAFYNCTGLTQVHITDLAAWCGIIFESSSMMYTYCDNNPLQYAKNLYLNGEIITDLVIPDGVTSIRNYAFYGYDRLTSVTIPDGVTSIGRSAFSGCYNLTSITIPDSVTSIGSDAFCDCDSLTSVTIPDSVTSIGDYAFYDCDSLTSVTIPDSVTYIGEGAFYDCDSLASVTIPDSVTYIGYSAFYECTSLTQVHITDLAAWCGISFESSSSNPLVYGVKLYLNGELVTDLAIPDGVTSIGNYAFYECDSLTSITIPDSVTSIGRYAFKNCTRLTSITIPDSVTTIDDGAFYNCTGLTSVTIGNSVTSIGEDAFYDCDSLTSIIIPDSVTSIGLNAFYGCTNVTNIVIGDGITDIEEGAFCGCYNLTYIILPPWLDQIKESAFGYCDNIKTVYHRGSPATWDRIVVGKYNGGLTSANIIHKFAGNSLADIIGRIVFKDWNGDVISSKAYEIGETVAIPNAPTREADNVYTYTFAGWNNDVVENCAGDATYTATYTPSYIDYTVEFKNWNGDVISSNIYHWGDEITVPANPTKAADDTYIYTFTGWDTEVVNCAGNATYTATYTATTIKELALISQPDKMRYRTGERLDLTGLTLQCVAANDESISLNSVSTQCVSADLSTPGKKAVTITVAGKSVVFGIYVHDAEESIVNVDSSLYPQSSHNYSNNLNETKTFTYPGAQSLVITFNSQTSVENDYDYIYIYDGAGNQIAKYTGTAAANKTLTIPGDTFKVKLTSDSSQVKYGYAFSSIQANTNSGEILHPPVIDPATITCTQGGLTEGSHCSICGDILVAQQEVSALGHDYKTVFTWSEDHKSCTVAITCERDCGLYEVVDCVITHSEPHQEQTVHTAEVVHDGTRLTDVLICDNFLIIFKNWDGTQISSTYYHAGDAVTAPSNPTKAADNTYTYAFAGWDKEVVNCAGNATYTATYIKQRKLAITTQPVGVTVKNGATAKVTVSVTGDGLTYQWYYKSATASGFTKSSNTTATYSATMNTSRNGYQVYCIITDQYGNKVTTNTVTLKMQTPLTISKQPVGVTVKNGATAKVTVSATGDGLKYQWYYKSATASGFTKSSNTTATYSTTMAAARNGYKVYCVITDQYGNKVTTNTVTLKMQTAVKITSQPVGVTVKNGATAKVTVSATGDGLKYQWYYKSATATKYTKSSNTTATYSTTMNASRNGYQVYCVITDQYGNKVTTNTVTLKMQTAVKITKQPVGVTVKNGATAKVTVSATGDGLKYQWYYKSATASGFTKSSNTTATYSTTMNTARNGYKVYCVITDQYGNKVTTNTVTLNKK